jgi:hypothetical protein
MKTCRNSRPFRASLWFGLAIAPGLWAQNSVTLTFSDLDLAAESAWEGSADASGFSSQGFHFNTDFTDWGGGATSWSGFAYSNLSDNTTPGYANDTSAITGGGADSSTGATDPYVIAFGSSRGQSVITLPTGTIGAPQSMKVTNTTYAYFSMRDGDDFAKKFGGEDGTDEDFFTLTIYGLNYTGAITGQVEVDLADFRGESTLLLDSWTDVDLTPLGDQVTAVTFALESSDVGSFGMNTPGYFALDTLAVDLEAQIIADARVESDSPWKHAWIGWYQDGRAPWVYQRPLGWIHWTATPATEGAWIYSQDAGAWFWTSRQTYPSIWRAATSDWVYLYHLSQPGALQYYDFATQTWVTGAAHL